MDWSEPPNNKTIILEIWTLLEKKRLLKKHPTQEDLEKKIAVLEKQLQWEKLRADALDTMINVAEEKLTYCHQKKAWKPAVQEIKKANQFVSLQTICRLLGYSPQAYHKHQNKTLRKSMEQGAYYRRSRSHKKTYNPGVVAENCLWNCNHFLKSIIFSMGRDKFFDVLRENKLLVRKQKRNVYTTMSKHHFRRYPNLAKDFMPLKAHELWVADITYIPLKHRFAYLFLITDAYSRKIVGFHVSDDMKVSSAVIALKKALAQKPADAIVMHHSDRGLQYCSTEYVSLLIKNNALISMTQNGDPYENAIAERVNGILKTELISNYYDTMSIHASRHIARCITIYNYKRRHASLNWQIPAVVHTQKGPQIKRWKNYYYKRKKTDDSIQKLS